MRRYAGDPEALGEALEDLHDQVEGTAAPVSLNDPAREDAWARYAR